MPRKHEHTCVLRDLGDFKKDSLKQRTQSHEGKEYRVLYGRLKSNDKQADAEYFYPTDHWTEKQARAHCRSHKGKKFHPATESKSEAFRPQLARIRRRLHLRQGSLPTTPN